MQANINNSFFIRPLIDRHAAFERILHAGGFDFKDIEQPTRAIFVTHTSKKISSLFDTLFIPIGAG